MVDSEEQQPLVSKSSKVQYISIPSAEDTNISISNNSNVNISIDESINNDNHIPIQYVKRRKSILDHPIGSFRGVNSLSRFATSVRRANSFRTISISNNFNDNLDLDFVGDNSFTETSRRVSTVLHNNGLNSLSGHPSILNIQDPVGRYQNNILNSNNNLLDSSSFQVVEQTIDLGQNANHNPNDISVDMDTDYDQTSVNTYNNTINNTILLDHNSIINHSNEPLDSADSIVIQRVEKKDGTVITIVSGKSTAPQTIFNSINVLIGMGLLALPLGLKYAGWALGLIMLSIFAFSTFCTAELLSRCLDTDPNLLSYADLGYAAFGAKGRALVSVIFTLDLLCVGVSLIILFGDSLNALIPSYSSDFFKIMSFFIVTPGVFIPLSILSNISLLGIISTIGTVFLIFVCGIFKKDQPGSLLNPMPTNLWPLSFKELCLSIGLLSACWGGHAVFPNLKTDMRHPYKFKSCLKKTYKITALTDFSTAIVGFLMFGNSVKGEITKNVMITKGYPEFIYLLISFSMAMIPIAKTPLNARPIISVLDTLMNINHIEFKYTGFNLKLAKFLQIWNKIFVNISFIVVAILFPAFDKLIAFLGAGLVFFICLILPCSFYLKICKYTIKPWERIACITTIVVSIILGVLGVTAAILS
ncbi:hypothetical protein TBLA_0D03110 [Henningerozyma blattae CBS 6284]|uniref:Amino acid transporter transmembrane domain-containing protein n=1 Tax=Henningerozyma blattae (strain ATCC 34711 / CBS 6284 / DSM 70876 / NBRC 10599 / NRRL Y-10934 / UCD 77-7) TaxID=1071380 RepID=I2H359_HENB6|nr:hypothetical protein TBLA_0D03110 [Tetrapisispora blattae CBS 6284]CCH60811.1 hypothetical protein TBLA_0D03110 [Tetrapisispora blattae CBS 6284]